MRESLAGWALAVRLARGKDVAMDDTREMNSVPGPGQPSQEEHPDTHLEREDARFEQKGRLKDWLTLILMMAAYLVWTGIVYFFEPGIR
ncbi:MAG: hypothetical protein ACK2TX_00595 [Anaerolineales bacterium]